MEENKIKLSGEGIFDSALLQIKKRQERAALGHVNCIPFPFERTSQFFPGIERGTYDICTANSGVGKSKLARFLYVIVPYTFIKENPDTDIRLKIFYFSLEESKEKFMMSIISYWLFVQHNMRVSIKQLRSVGNVGYYLPDDVIAKIEEAKEYFADLEKYVTIIDHIHNPTGIFKTMKSYNESKGKWTKRIITIDGVDKEVNDTYIPDDVNEYVIAITDHIGLLRTERGLSKHETISRFSSEHCIELRNKYANIVVNVQQQSSDKEKKQYTFKGQSIDEKLEPSLDGLANNKETQRDADNVFGLFAPDRYQMEECDGYKVDVMQDHFRMLLILKSRDGEANVRTPLFFDGACSYFKELPRIEDTGAIEKVYQYTQNL